MAAWPAAATRSTEARGGGTASTESWPQLMARWLFGIGEEHRQPELAPSPVARFQNICISREAGAGAGILARHVGERLHWKVYDDELIQAIAHRMVLPIDEVKALDEQAPSMVQDWLLPLREEYYAPQEAYLDHLAKLIEAIGRAGESILVGRGAGFMLPRESTLSIRIIAPLKSRAQRLAERMGVSLRTARRAARDLDRRRAQFDRTMHRANPNDAHNFDMVLDTHSLGFEIATEIIVRAVMAGHPDGAIPGLRARPDPATASPAPSLPAPALWTAESDPVALPSPAAPKSDSPDSPGQTAVPSPEPPSRAAPG